MTITAEQIVAELQRRASHGEDVAASRSIWSALGRPADYGTVLRGAIRQGTIAQRRIRLGGARRTFLALAANRWRLAGDVVTETSRPVDRTSRA